MTAEGCWQPARSRIQVLDTPSGYLSQAQAINDQGTIIGSRYTATSTSKATVWINGVGSELSRESDGQASSANGINSSGRIAGLLNTFPLIYTAVAWDDTGRTSMGGGWSANDINSSNIAVGTTLAHGGPGNAVMWNGTARVYLPGASNPNISSSAQAINNAGFIVGSFNGGPVLWFGNTMTGLAALPGVVVDANWVMNQVSDINDRGDIVGTAVNSITGESRAFLLSVSPVPEPIAIWLMSVGLLGVGVARRVRTTRNDASEESPLKLLI